MTKAGLWMGYNWYGFSWDICEIYKDLYLGFILGIYTYNATKTWDIIHFNSWSIFGSPQKMVIFCYQSKVGDEWPSKSNVGLSRSQEPFNHLQCPRSHSKCLVVKWGYKWINPTYPIYNWGYNPLSNWMSHQVGFCQSHPTIFEQLYDFCQSQSHMNVAKKYRCEDGFMTPNIRPTKSLEMLVLGCWCPRKEDLMRTWWGLDG